MVHLPIVGTPRSVGETFLFVFDFDDTIIRGNSDVLIPQALGVVDKINTAIANRDTCPQWTHLLSETMASFSRADIKRVLTTAIQLEPEMKRLFEMLQRLRVSPGPVTVPTPTGVEHASAVRVEFVVASDANTCFIEEAFEQLVGVPLEAHRLYSNPFIDLTTGSGGNDGGDSQRRSRIDWFQPPGVNRCPHCSKVTPNMCKSSIVQDALNSFANGLTDVTVVYVGNGSNDACPIRNVLRARDHAFILGGDRLEATLRKPLVPDDAEPDSSQSLSFPESLFVKRGAGVCNHHIWKSAEELLNQISRLLGQAPSAGVGSASGFIRPPHPPLALFDGEGGIKKEFRTKRIWKDIPALYDRLITCISDIISNLKEADGGGAHAAEGGKDISLIGTVEGWERARSHVLLQRKSLEEGECSWSSTKGSSHDTNAWLSLIESEAVLPVPFQLRNYGNHWAQTPWLAGEIYMNILHWHVMQSAVFGKAASAASWFVDGVDSVALPQKFIKKDPRGNLAVELAHTPRLDVYEAEKDVAINAFAKSHIFPMVSTVYADIVRTGSLISEEADANEDADVPNPGFSEALWLHIERTVESLLMACTWGNAVDLAMFSNDELAARHLSKKENNFDAEKDESADAKRHAAEVGQRNMMASNAIPEMAHHIVHNIIRNNNPRERQHHFIDIVQDNVGVECCADMLFALYITQVSTLLINSSNNSSPFNGVSVRLHSKPVSYFVSDVMPKDINRMVDAWEASLEEPVVRAAALFKDALTHFDGSHDRRPSGVWPSVEIHSHPFWVYPSEYSDLPPSLARQFFFSKRLATTDSSYPALLEEVTAYSSLVVFKGDLNFRRVCGDRHWNKDMFFKLTQREAFESGRQIGTHEDEGLVNVGVRFTTVLEHYWPYQSVPIAALRTNKSELCVGVTKETMDRLDQEVGPAGWRFSGSYAVALFASAEYNSQ